MPSYNRGPNLRKPFGKNVYLRSTRGLQFDHGTFAASTCPSTTIDGYTQKVLQPGTALARITSGAETGKLGPVDAGASDGRQTAANFVGICDTFLPYQLIDRDVEVAYVYSAAVVTANCFQVASGAWIVIQAATITALKPGGTAGAEITFHVASTEVQPTADH